MVVAGNNWSRGLKAEERGHIRTAMNCRLRAADYYRQAEFYLEPGAIDRLTTFEKMEACSHKFLQYLNPADEVVDIPSEDGKPICGYFIRAPYPEHAALLAAARLCKRTLIRNGTRSEGFLSESHGRGNR